MISGWNRWINFSVFNWFSSTFGSLSDNHQGGVYIAIQRLIFTVVSIFLNLVL